MPEPRRLDLPLAPSILEAFRDMCDASPDRVLFVFVDDAGRDAETVRVGDLARDGHRIARSLGDWGIAAGDRVALVYPPSLDFIRALVGCLIAGVIPVPVYPPDPLRPGRLLTGLSAVVADCGAKAALTNRAYDRARTLGRIAGVVGRARHEWPKIPWHRTDRGRDASSPPRWPLAVAPDAPALLQYTSGSTGTPRGVMISHRNLWEEIRANAADLSLGAGTRGVFWLPQYHDFGLISVILSALGGNADVAYLLSPLTFVQRPAVWFSVMSRVRATHTAAPNFAFELSVRRTTPEMRSGWDLRSLQVVMSAAEPIRPATVDAFFDAFAVTGLDPRTFYPAYGLAEHTVSVTMGGTRRLRLDKAALEARKIAPLAEGTNRPCVTLVGCGRVTKPHARVRIVDPETNEACGADEVGEIWVDSPTKALGYWGRPDETRATFRATLAADDDASPKATVDKERGGIHSPRADDASPKATVDKERGGIHSRRADDATEYLRTGDLGFIDGDELFVTGRLKDLIVIHGRNYYPQDIEDSVRDCHPLIRPGGLAAFAAPPAADHDEERLVLFVECRQEKLPSTLLHELLAAVRQRVHEDHGLSCAAIVLGTAGLVRKTTSGKVRRHACLQAFIETDLPAPSTIGVYTARDSEERSARRAEDAARRDASRDSEEGSARRAKDVH
jgi:acyl-CoA synthetase (AMP-forming)/AMP-acid ligase II